MISSSILSFKCSESCAQNLFYLPSCLLRYSFYFPFQCTSQYNTVYIISKTLEGNSTVTFVCRFEIRLIECLLYFKLFFYFNCYYLKLILQMQTCFFSCSSNVVMIYSTAQFCINSRKLLISSVEFFFYKEIVSSLPFSSFFYPF